MARRKIVGPYQDPRRPAEPWVVTARDGAIVTAYPGRTPQEACRLAGIRSRPPLEQRGRRG